MGDRKENFKREISVTLELGLDNPNGGNGDLFVLPLTGRLHNFFLRSVPALSGAKASGCFFTAKSIFFPVLTQKGSGCAPALHMARKAYIIKAVLKMLTETRSYIS